MFQCFSSDFFFPCLKFANCQLHMPQPASQRLLSNSRPKASKWETKFSAGGPKTMPFTNSNAEHLYKIDLHRNINTFQIDLNYEMIIDHFKCRQLVLQNEYAISIEPNRLYSKKKKKKIAKIIHSNQINYGFWWRKHTCWTHSQQVSLIFLWEKLNAKFKAKSIKMVRKK